MKKLDEIIMDGLVIGLVFGLLLGLVSPLGGVLFNSLLGVSGAALLTILTTTRAGFRFPLSIGIGLSIGFGGWVFLCNDLLARMGIAIGRLPPFREEWLRNLPAALCSALAIIITVTISYFIKLSLVKIYGRVREIFA